MIEVRNKDDFNEYIESLLVNYESDDLEFKSAAGGFPRTFGILILPSLIVRVE